MEILQHRNTTVFGILMLFFLTFITSQRTQNYPFLHEAASAPLKSYYDYIIVGGGTAGCPLAATLSENATVLLLERGGSPYADPNITSIDAFGRALRDDSPWSPSQAFVSEDGVANNRARVLGGGTCINGGFYTRADAKFLKEVGLVDDDEKLLNESYKWVEEKIVFKPNLKKWQSAFKDGLLEAGVLPDNGYTYDHLYGTKVSGVTYDKDGNRYMAADLLDYANPNRITIRLHATVIKILFTKGKSGEMAASGVVFRDSFGTERIAYLKESESNKNEIILSAGTIGTPQLLMLSGVGPAQHLNSLNITVVLDQPLVGKGLSDNTFNVIFVPSRLPLEVSIPQAVGITRFGSYIEAISHISLQLPTVDQKEDIYGGYIGPKIMGPLSSGYMELKNRNPDDNPTVTFNYFSDPKDLERCINGLKITEKVIESKSFSEFGNHSFSDLLNLTSNFKFNFRAKHENASTSLEQFCKDNVITIWHYHGGCQIGKVVDQDFKIMGLDSIRVIDSSIFVSSPGTNPQATVMMLGRYMGVKMLRERSNIVQKTGEWQNDDFSNHFVQ